MFAGSHYDPTLCYKLCEQTPKCAAITYDGNACYPSTIACIPTYVNSNPYSINNNNNEVPTAYSSKTQSIHAIGNGQNTPRQSCFSNYYCTNWPGMIQKVLQYNILQQQCNPDWCRIMCDLTIASNCWGYTYTPTPDVHFTSSTSTDQWYGSSDHVWTRHRVRAGHRWRQQRRQPRRGAGAGLGEPRRPGGRARARRRVLSQDRRSLLARHTLPLRHGPERYAGAPAAPAARRPPRQNEVRPPLGRHDCGCPACALPPPLECSEAAAAHGAPGPGPRAEETTRPARVPAVVRRPKTPSPSPRRPSPPTRPRLQLGVTCPPPPLLPPQPSW